MREWEWEGDRETEGGRERDVERGRETERPGERSSRRERTGDAVSGGLEADPSMAGAGSLIEGTQELKPARPGEWNPQLATRQPNRRIRENLCDPNPPEVRSSTSGGPCSGFRWAVTCVQQPSRSPKPLTQKPDPWPVRPQRKTRFFLGLFRRLFRRNRWLFRRICYEKFLG
jgi:hypothetical protein